MGEVGLSLLYKSYKPLKCGPLIEQHGESVYREGVGGGGIRTKMDDDDLRLSS